MLRCRTSVTWTTKRLRTTEMTTASASAWTISRIARQDEGACSRGSSYSGRMTVWGVANSSSVYGRSVSTPEQARSGQCENLGDEPCRRALDHLRGAIPGKGAEVLIQSGAGVAVDLLEDRRAVALQRARRPVRAHQAALPFCGALDPRKLGECFGHLLRREITPVATATAQVEAVRVAGREA